MPEIVYAVHTRSCTYLLDDDGICRWVLSRSGQKSDDRCVGAQFVAALDLQSRGGLVGELRIGACALFIRSEDGRFVLIRTKPIEHVEMRGEESEEAQATEPASAVFPYDEDGEPVVLPSHHAVAGVFNAPTSALPPEPHAGQRVILHGVADPHTESYPPPGPRPQLPVPPLRTGNVGASHPNAAPGNVGASHPNAAPGNVGASHPNATSRMEQRRIETEPPPPPAPPPMVTRPPLPIAPPRTPMPATRSSSGASPSRAARASRPEPQETQPLPSPPTVLTAPSGRVPAWPAMLAPPPPQAEMLPLGPARPHLPSAEELDVNDLEEVGEDEQVYSMEVTLSLPLFRQDSNPGYLPPFRRQ